MKYFIFLITSVYSVHSCIVCICHNEVSFCNVSHEQIDASNFSTSHNSVNTTNFLFNDTIMSMPSGVIFTLNGFDCSSKNGPNISLVDCSIGKYVQDNPMQHKNIEYISLMIVIILVVSARIIMVYRNTSKLSTNSPLTHSLITPHDLDVTISPDTNPDPHPVNTLNKVGVPGSLLSFDQLP